MRTDMNTEKPADEYLRENLLRLMDETNISMTQLSLSIGASASYIQKVLSGEIQPSIEKVEAMGRYFGCEPWELISDPEQDTKAYAETIDMMSQLSESQLSILHDYMEYLLALQDAGGAKKKR